MNPKKAITPTGRVIHMLDRDSRPYCGVGTARPCWPYMDGRLCGNCARAAEARRRKAAPRRSSGQ